MLILSLVLMKSGFQVREYITASFPRNVTLRTFSWHSRRQILEPPLTIERDNKKEAPAAAAPPNYEA